MMISRRIGLGALSTFGLTAMTGACYAKTNPTIRVTKGRGCGCCTAWANILEQHGFTVVEESKHPSALVMQKKALGIPEDLFSCHTATIDGYIVEGHVPPQDILRILQEKPIALGIAVAGMPYGSPGMGPEDARESYNVILFKKGGTQEIYSSYDAAAE